MCIGGRQINIRHGVQRHNLRSSPEHQPVIRILAQTLTRRRRPVSFEILKKNQIKADAESRQLLAADKSIGFEFVALFSAPDGTLLLLAVVQRHLPARPIKRLVSIDRTRLVLPTFCAR